VLKILAKLLPRSPECNTYVTLAQLRASDAVRCSSLCRRTYHNSCVALSDDVLKLLLNPNILWQCDSCVVANDSHSKIDEFDDKLKALERLYQGLHNKFLEDCIDSILRLPRSLTLLLWIL